MLDGMGDPAPPMKGHSPNFSVHVYCGQTAGWIKMPLGTEVGLGPDYIVLDGNPALNSPLKGSTAPSNFRLMSIVAQRSPISATAEHLLLNVMPSADEHWDESKFNIFTTTTTVPKHRCLFRNLLPSSQTKTLTVVQTNLLMYVNLMSCRFMHCSGLSTSAAICRLQYSVDCEPANELCIIKRVFHCA